MRPVSREEARAIDRVAQEEFGIPRLLLMENAAIGIAHIARELARDRPGAVRIFCGPGNNGGDGLAAARHLRNASAAVTLHVLAPDSAYPPGSDAAVHYAIARAMRIDLRRDATFDAATAVVVDALFGTGLTRAVEEPYRSAIGSINSCGAPVLAVDIPSGLDADTGAVLGAAVRATVTATMAAPKRGFFVGEGPAHVGEVHVVDLGVPPEAILRAVAR